MPEFLLRELRGGHGIDQEYKDQKDQIDAAQKKYKGGHR